MKDLNSMAQDILRQTNDGADLADQDHLLILHVVNGTLNNSGIDAFTKLYERVTAGTYGVQS